MLGLQNNVKGENYMKVSIDLENLESLVKGTIETNIETVVKEQVEAVIKKTIENLAKDTINDAVSANFERFVNEYITTTMIKVGGNSYWNDEESKEYTVEQYIKRELKARLESNTLRVKKKGKTSSYSDDFENVAFEEYINRQYNFDDMIRKDLDKFMDDIRKNVNKTMKDTFDNSTKSMLSNAVLSVLSANDTYRQIENNIKCIADKQG